MRPGFSTLLCIGAAFLCNSFFFGGQTVDMSASFSCDTIAGRPEDFALPPYKDQYLDGETTAPRLMMGEAGAYAGDVSPQNAYNTLKTDEAALLIDVRSKAEWGFVGIVDLSELGKSAGLIEWISFPAMAQNENFVAELDRLAGGAKDRAAFFICRSGQRSRNAAIAATAAGYTRAYNIGSGFEGSLNRDRHRGQVDGWKAAGLPWAQT